MLTPPLPVRHQLLPPWPRFLRREAVHVCGQALHIGIHPVDGVLCRQPRVAGALVGGGAHRVRVLLEAHIQDIPKDGAQLLCDAPHGGILPRLAGNHLLRQQDLSAALSPVWQDLAGLHQHAVLVARVPDGDLHDVQLSRHGVRVVQPQRRLVGGDLLQQGRNTLGVSCAPPRHVHSARRQHLSQRRLRIRVTAPGAGVSGARHGPPKVSPRRAEGAVKSPSSRMAQAHACDDARRSQHESPVGR